MTCGLPDGIQINFTTSGVKVRPVSGDIRHKRRNFAAASFTLDENAANIVNRNAEPGEAVNVFINGVRVRRFYYPNDALTFKTDTSGSTIADLLLEDPRYVLQRGNVNKEWGSARIDDIVSYVLAQREDPYDVITGYEYLSEEVATARREESLSLRGNWGPFTEEINGFQTAVQNNTQDFLDAFGWEAAEENRTYSLDFNNITPLEAMRRVTADFETEWFVDPFGTVRIGVDPGYGQVIGAFADYTGVALSEYTVTSAGTRTNNVLIEAPSTVGTIAETDLRLRRRDNVVKVLAEASDPTVDGETKAFETRRIYHDIENAENAAVRKLVRTRMDEVEGSIQINGLASENKDFVAALDIGDVIYVDESVAGRCESAVASGLLLVNTVNHKISKNAGWTIDLRVSRYLQPSDIQSRSVLYDPLTDKTYSSLEAYREASGPKVQ
jgi:hypothetical protein